MLRAGRHQKQTVPNLYSSAFSIGARKAKRQRTKATGRRSHVSRPIHSRYKMDENRRDVRYFGHSRSDSFDACALRLDRGCA